MEAGAEARKEGRKEEKQKTPEHGPKKQEEPRKSLGRTLEGHRKSPGRTQEGLGSFCRADPDNDVDYNILIRIKFIGYNIYIINLINSY